MATDRLYAEREAISNLSENFAQKQEQAQTALESIKSSVETLSGDWEGTHKTALNETFNEAYASMAALATDCEKLCSSIRSALDVIIAAEEQTTSQMAQ